MIFTPHSKQQSQALKSEKPIVLLATGIQYGKTTVGSIKLILAMMRHAQKTDNFLLLAPTYKIMQQSTLPAFLALAENYGEYSKVDSCFKFYDGGICWMRTATDPNSIVGITNVKFIWADEAGMMSLYFWENIQARAAIANAQIILTTSPYTLNWI